MTPPQIINVSLRQGPPGPVGPSGRDASQYLYTQSVPTLSATVVHNLNRIPGSVSVYTLAGEEVLAQVQVVDLNTIQVTTELPFTGTVVVT